MSDLYQQVIIDHAQSPRNQGKCEHATHSQKGHNPLCGDQLTLSLQMNGDVVEDLRFEGDGCAISMASASLMTEAIKGKTREQVDALFAKVHALVTEGAEGDDPKLGKLVVLKGVHAYPMRVKCATLAWHTLQAALDGDSDLVSTED